MTLRFTALFSLFHTYSIDVHRESIMANMPESLTEPIATQHDCRTLARDARHLPLPPTVEDYYRGWKTDGYWGARLPDNILLFSVTERHRLSEAPVNDYHHRHVFVVPLCGTAVVEVDAEAYDMHPGDVLLIRPFQLHDYQSVRGRTFCWLFVTFDLPVGLEEWERGPRRLSREALSLLSSLVRWRRQHARDAPPAIRRSATLTLMLLLTRLSVEPGATAQPRDRRPTTDPWLETVLTKIHTCKGTPPTLTSLSHESGVSASHLRALWRARFGVSLGRYLRDYRIKRSISLLSSSSVTVTQAAELSGYTSVYSFSRAFRRTMGCSPTQYVSRMRR